VFVGDGSRSSKLGRPVKRLGDGSLVGAGELVVEGVALGLDYQSACDSAGVSRSALRDWRLRGGRLRALEVQGLLGSPSEYERALIDFVSALEWAEAEAEERRLRVIERAAEGGGEVRRVSRRFDSEGVEVESTVVVEELKPEWQAAAWFLERRLPHRYAKRLELSGVGGEPLVGSVEKAEGLAESLRAFRAELEAGRRELGEGEVVDVEVVDDGTVEGDVVVDVDGGVG
jgi:hypothetical protein